MKFFSDLLDIVLDVIDAKNAGLTSDDSIMNFFRAEYKKDPEGAYEYWLTNGKDRFNFG